MVVSYKDQKPVILYHHLGVKCTTRSVSWAWTMEAMSPIGCYIGFYFPRSLRIFENVKWKITKPVKGATIFSRPMVPKKGRTLSKRPSRHNSVKKICFFFAGLHWLLDVTWSFLSKERASTIPKASGNIIFFLQHWIFAWELVFSHGYFRIICSRSFTPWGSWF